ncbi:MAG: acyl-CoA synthetase FdrA [Halobacteriaceae archaeon]
MEVVTLSDTYQDSVKLMRIANEARESFGVEEAVAMMGTQENKDILRNLGASDGVLADLQPDDLILGVKDDDVGAAREAVEWMEAEVSGAAGGEAAEESTRSPPKSVYGALERHPDANLGLISVPGEYATREAWKALHEGLHVHIFSDNVGLEHERKLKSYGRDHDQLVMGPDSGTAIINGVPLGFANEVDGGAIGVVSAAGSGLQEVTSLIDRAGAGISQAIGTGGRDLDDEIGGIAMQQGFEMLADDDATEVIVLVSKPPDERTMDDILQLVEDGDHPVVVEFVGSDPAPIEAVGGRPASSLADAARQAITALPDRDTSDVDFADGITAFTSPGTGEDIVDRRDHPGAGRRSLRGLYSGGTLCSEAATILAEDVDVQSNVGVGTPIDDPLSPTGHAMIDLGADEFTRGRPHPMIDSSIRDDQLRGALTDDEVLVVLLDVILGYAAHEDPATPVVDVMESVDPGEWPVVVASVVGTRGDPQGWEDQVQTLADAGVVVCESNADAVALARDVQATVADTGGGHR